MAASKSKPGTVRLTHPNGTTVVVSADKAEQLVAGHGFAEAKSTSSTSSK